MLGTPCACYVNSISEVEDTFILYRRKITGSGWLSGMPTITQLAITETYLCPDASVHRPHILASRVWVKLLVLNSESGRCPTLEDNY